MNQLEIIPAAWIQHIIMKAAQEAREQDEQKEAAKLAAIKAAVRLASEEPYGETHCPICGAWCMNWAFERHLKGGYCQEPPTPSQKEESLARLVEAGVVALCNCGNRLDDPRLQICEACIRRMHNTRGWGRVKEEE